MEKRNLLLNHQIVYDSAEIYRFTDNYKNLEKFQIIAPIATAALTSFGLLLSLVAALSYGTVMTPLSKLEFTLSLVLVIPLFILYFVTRSPLRFYYAVGAAYIFTIIAPLVSLPNNSRVVIDPFMLTNIDTGLIVATSILAAAVAYLNAVKQSS